MEKACYQINLQTGFGGGEVYTRFFTRALLALGWKVFLLAPGKATWWHGLDEAGATILTVDSAADIEKHVPRTRSLLIFQTMVATELADRLRQTHLLACFAHMPLYGRNPEIIRHYDLIFAVSRHVITSLQEAGITRYYPEPMYGLADLGRPQAQKIAALRANSVYDWDMRKFRDRLLSHLYPLYSAMKPSRIFARRDGLTLGIVSRLTPIKQFPLMFRILAPVIRQFPRVNLEIFGSGGFASVRDLERSLAPIASQVRWWGHQHDVKSIYPQMDFLLAGLPEKEALGLNVIEAQACGTPVLAVNAPPFTETVLEAETGYFFTDPRHDQGRDFRRLLEQLCATDGQHPDPRKAQEHLEKFSFAQFVQRTGRAMDAAVVLAEETACA
ncbi:MAG: glycosyltransferase family 4 protein [Sulfuricella denitrificans]|nr:glycosyltransferase family 4 protein [Sulfuricella denitrificans]